MMLHTHIYIDAYYIYYKNYSIYYIFVILILINNCNSKEKLTITNDNVIN